MDTVWFVDDAEIGPSVAGRWFEVRAEYQRFGPLSTSLSVVRELLLALATFGLFLGEWDPKRFCDVLVVRRDNGETVAKFSYRRLGGASLQVESFGERLETQPIFDFCRELGIPMSDVEGGGREPDQTRRVTWVAISRRQRRRNLHRA